MFEDSSVNFQDGECLYGTRILVAPSPLKRKGSTRRPTGSVTCVVRVALCLEEGKSGNVLFMERPRTVFMEHPHMGCALAGCVSSVCITQQNEDPGSHEAEGGGGGLLPFPVSSLRALVLSEQTHKEPVGVTRGPAWDPQLIFLHALAPFGISGVVFNWMAHQEVKLKSRTRKLTLKYRQTGCLGVWTLRKNVLEISVQECNTLFWSFYFETRKTLMYL